MFKKKKNTVTEYDNAPLTNSVVFEGTLTRAIQETAKTEGVFSFKLKGMVNDTACEIPVIVKSFILAEDLRRVKLYSNLLCKGHLEYPIWRTHNGKSFKSKLIFVVDRYEVKEC